MTIKQKITDFENAFGKKIPLFYVDFIVQENLQNSRLFNNLTLLYGIDDLLKAQDLTQQYLPNYIKIGNDGGDYGIFINIAPNVDDHIYITEMGDLDVTSLEMLANNLADWAAKNYDTEQFLLVIYENQVSSPLLKIKQSIALINTQIKNLNLKRNTAELDLKSYIVEKRTLETQLAALKAQETALYEKVTAQQKTNIRLTTTEQTFNVVLPALYKKLEADNMLDYARDFGPDWYKNEGAVLDN